VFSELKKAQLDTDAGSGGGGDGGGGDGGGGLGGGGGAGACTVSYTTVPVHDPS
jgi:hypothetical protein